MPSTKQRSKMKKILARLEWPSEKKRAFVSKVVGREVASAKDLSADEVDAVVKRAAKLLVKKEKRDQKAAEKQEQSQSPVNVVSEDTVEIDCDDTKYGRFLKRCEDLVEKCGSLPKDSGDLGEKYVERLRKIYKSVSKGKRVTKAQEAALGNMELAVSEWEVKA